MKKQFIKYNPTKLKLRGVNKIITIFLLISLSFSAYFLSFDKTETAEAGWPPARDGLRPGGWNDDYV